MAQDERGDVAPLDPTAVANLRASLLGYALEPGDEGYDAARKVWNGMIDRRPALIIRVAGVSDVIASVRFAREQDACVAVRGGGHNVAGNAVCDGGVVIDLSLQKGIRVDPARRIAHAQGGVNWREFDRETQSFGLATTGGLVSDTGIAGFTLGGGIGWLTRRHGLTCDNLLSADVVTADGTFLTASRVENPDLFWGLRGGGGNFGIVTSFEYRLHPVGPTVFGGAAMYPAERSREVLRFFRDLTTAAPDSQTSMVAFLTAPAAPFVPPELQGRPVVAIAMVHPGPGEEAEPLFRRIRAFSPPPVDLLGPIPYIAVQAMFDHSAPAGLLNYWKAAFLPGLTDAAMDEIAAYAARAPAPWTQIHVNHMGGAAARIPADDCAFGHRDAEYLVNIVGMWDDPAASEANTTWVRNFHAALESRGAGGTYVNFLGEEGPDRVRDAYEPDTYRRLVSLKRRYDPTNFFRMNQNIAP